MKRLNVEIVSKNSSTASTPCLIAACEEFFKRTGIVPGSTISTFEENEYLTNNITAIIVDDYNETNKQQFDSEKKVEENYVNQNNSHGYLQWTIQWYHYSLDTNGPQEDCSMGEGDDGDEITSLSTNWVLPSADLHGLWETLFYESEIKRNLIQYTETTLLFSSKLVDSGIIACNRVILLHGPPGTGKTSLCRALAHKIAARRSERYRSAQLIEIHSHSLFSKWFSESGKLVTKMFAHIRQICEDSSTLVFVLIDEVESLAHARTQAISGSEPSDSLRVVNAVLTQLDQLKRYHNVLVLTTSNITGSIDVAFVDRADIKQYIGLPSVEAIYQIYFSCLEELMKVRIIRPKLLFSLPELKLMESQEDKQLDSSYSESAELLQVCKISVGLSGRTLRKIPFLAHALFVEGDFVKMKHFLKAMELAVDKHRKDTNQINQSLF